MNKTNKIIENPNGTLRVLINKHGERRFGFESQELRHHYEDNDDLMESYPDDFVWIPIRDGSFAILASAEDAEREARGKVAWLRSA